MGSLYTALREESHVWQESSRLDAQCMTRGCAGDAQAAQHQPTDTCMQCRTNKHGARSAVAHATSAQA
eukprot:14054093-Alexandrium_andersonii.AAC.1